MEIKTIKTSHIRAMLNLYDVDDPLVRCIVDSYPEINIVFLDHLVELESLIKDLQHNSFTVFIVNREPYARYFTDIDDKDTFTRTATNLLALLIKRSFLVYAFYFNKGIRQYLLRNKEFVTAVVNTLLYLILVASKKSYIAINKDLLREIRILVIVYVLYCIFGIKSKTDVLSQLNKIVNISLMDKAKVLLFYDYLAKKISSSKSLIHIIGDLQKWNKMAIETMLINISRYLGPTLSDLLLNCNANLFDDNQLIFSLKIAQLHFYYESGVIHKECNVASLNRITKHEFSKIFTNLRKVSKMAHYGRC